PTPPAASAKSPTPWSRPCCRRSRARTPRTRTMSQRPSPSSSLNPRAAAPPAPSLARRLGPIRPTTTSRLYRRRWSRPSASAISKKSPDEPFRVSGLPADPASLSMPTQPSEGDMSSSEVLMRPTSLEQQKEDSMEFLVEFEVEVPAGTPDAEVEQRQQAESAAAAELAEDGHLVRLWRRPLAGDGTTAIGLYRADSEAELDDLLAALPLADWLRVTVTPLASHPNDPATAPR